MVLPFKDVDSKRKLYHFLTMKQLSVQYLTVFLYVSNRHF